MAAIVERPAARISRMTGSRSIVRASAFAIFAAASAWSADMEQRSLIASPAGATARCGIIPPSPAHAWSMSYRGLWQYSYAPEAVRLAS